MTNTLYKNTLVSYVPGSPGVVEDNGAPYQPAYTSYDTVEVCTWRIVRTLTGAETGLIWVDNWVYSCQNETTATYHPEEPARSPLAGAEPTPSQFITDYQLGWNAGARSIASLATDGYASFVVPHSNAGSFVGLNDADLDAGYMELDYAIYAHRGIAEVYELGVFKHYIGAYDEGAVFKIRRRRGVVTYLVDDVVTYTSLTPSTGTVFMDVSIYTGGDYVDSPQLVDEHGGEAAMSFLPMDAFGYEGAGSSRAALSFEPMTVSGRTGIHVAMSFLPMDLLASDKTYGEAAMSMEPLTMDASGGLLIPTYAVASLAMVPLGVYGHGLTGEIGSAAMSMLPPDMLAADKPYGEAAMSMLPPAMYAYNYAGPDEAFMFSGARAASTLVAPMSLYVTIDSQAEVASVFAFDLRVSADMVSTATVDTPALVQQVLLALMYSTTSGMSTGPMEDHNPQVWVVNTENLGSTRYEDYPFNSFAKIGGVYYGARSDGIYQLDGDTDNGLPVRAMVDFGLQGFDTSAGKRVENAYLGVSATGRLFMAVTVGEKRLVYAARHTTTTLEAQRVDFGRGVEGTYLGFELYNEDGADFELATVEFVAIPLKRRI